MVRNTAGIRAAVSDPSRAIVAAMCSTATISRRRTPAASSRTARAWASCAR
jgi:hypothetical protein